MSLRRAFAIPNEIRRYRKRVHLRLRDVARLLGIADHTHVSHWEKGRKFPTLANALKLSAIIACPIEAFYARILGQYRSEIRKREKHHNIKRTYG